MTDSDAATAMSGLQIPARTDLTTEPGWYIVHARTRDEPLLLRWTRWTTRRQYSRNVSPVPVPGWLGTVRGVKGEPLCAPCSMERPNTPQFRSPRPSTGTRRHRAPRRQM